MQPSPSGRACAASARKAQRLLDETIITRHPYHHLRHRYTAPPPSVQSLALPNDVRGPYLTRATEKKALPQFMGSCWKSSSLSDSSLHLRQRSAIENHADESHSTQLNLHGNQPLRRYVKHRSYRSRYGLKMASTTISLTRITQA